MPRDGIQYLLFLVLLARASARITNDGDLYVWMGFAEQSESLQSIWNALLLPEGTCYEKAPCVIGIILAWRKMDPRQIDPQSEHLYLLGIHPQVRNTAGHMWPLAQNKVH